MILVDRGKFVLGKYKSKYDTIIMLVIILLFIDGLKTPMVFCRRHDVSVGGKSTLKKRP